ncbi:hypothetical protein [Massilia antarctica]|uniref:hypothetical protein n=1 Tax=Massilia antarctica TaxID=2765360 RepID=UPI002270AC87|nr:hypothetical protein [Massilia sp. H27-R4]MCY0910896.1 hypothetical protein [Massilia sp. H27-R4]
MKDLYQLADDLEAERARSALLAASLKQADAQIAQLTLALREIIAINRPHLKPGVGAKRASNIAREALTAVGVL